MMPAAESPFRTQAALVVGVLLLMATAPGCMALNKSSAKPIPPPNIPSSIPRELSKATEPEYVIEPPDLLAISVVNLVPKQPYHLRPLDTVVVQATGTPEEAPIAGAYVVSFDGNLVLGFDYDYLDSAYQPLHAAGKTLEELRDDIAARLRTILNEPKVWISLGSIASQQDVSGEHLVAPDGRVTLGSYGRVSVVGMTIEGARAAIEAHLTEFFENPQVSVDVFGYNSKVYYVITQGAGLGDQVYRFPVKGSETALDAIAEIQGLPSNSSLRMWIARPGFNQSGGDQIMPIDWLGITQRGDVHTNYQLMPGDRLYVAEDHLVAIDTTLAKIISPVERILGVTLLGTRTAESISTYGTNDRGFLP